MPCGRLAGPRPGPAARGVGGAPSGRLGATHRPDEGARRRLVVVWYSRARCRHRGARPPPPAPPTPSEQAAVLLGNLAQIIEALGPGQRRRPRRDTPPHPAGQRAGRPRARPVSRLCLQHETISKNTDCCFRPIRHVHFPHDALDVLFRRSFREPNFSSDSFVRFTSNQVLEYLGLPLGE